MFFNFFELFQQWTVGSFQVFKEIILEFGENKIMVLPDLIPGNDKDKEKKTHPNC